MGLLQVTPPTAEPMTLAEAKLHLRVGTDFTDDDSLITRLVATARGDAETETKRQLVAARWQAALDRFPGQCAGERDVAIRLQRSPVLQVASIQYVDGVGATQTLDAAAYSVDLVSDPARIVPAYGYTWPSTRDQINAVTVTFDSGHCAPITADATADTITVRGLTTLAVNDSVRFSNSGGALPGGLAVDTDYYVQSVVSAGVYKLSATSGGSALDLTSAGTGTSYIGVVPPEIISWMKIRLAQLHEHREQVITGSIIQPMPFVDRLLDRYRAFGY